MCAFFKGKVLWELRHMSLLKIVSKGDCAVAVLSDFWYLQLRVALQLQLVSVSLILLVLAEDEETPSSAYISLLSVACPSGGSPQ